MPRIILLIAAALLLGLLAFAFKAQLLPSSLKPQDAAEFTKLWANSIRCPKEGFSIQAKPEDVVEVNGLRIYVNVVEVLFTKDATCEDAERIAQLINGKIKGFGPTTNVYGFFLPTRTPEELQAAIDKIKALNDPKIDAVSGAVPLRTFVP